MNEWKELFRANSYYSMVAMAGDKNGKLYEKIVMPGDKPKEVKRIPIKVTRVRKD